MHKYIFGLVIALVILLAAACSTDQPEALVVNEKNNSNASESVYNLDNDGIDEMEFEKDLEQFPDEIAEAVITTSVPIAEMLQLLGVTPVGVPTSTNPLPDEFNDIDQIGSPMEPNIEVITNLRPDLLIGAKSLEESLEDSLGGIELARSYLRTDSFDDLKRSFKVLGTYFNQTEKMNEVLENILSLENDLIKKTEGNELPSVLPIIGTSDSFMVMNENSYLGSLIEKLGAENIATTVLQAESTYSPISMEDVVVADPDIIFVLASGDHGASEDMFAKEVESNDVWKNLKAYQEKEIHILDHEIFGVTSIKNVDQAMTKIAEYFFE